MQLLRHLGLRGRILAIVALSCVILTAVSIGVARYFNELELHQGIIEKSRTIHSRLSAATEFVALQGGLRPAVDRIIAKHKSPDELNFDDKQEILKQVPIYAAMTIGAKDAEKENYVFRIFSDEPRRKENKATAQELEVFKEFEADPKLTEKVLERDGKIFVFKPVHLSEKQGCLVCHGNPESSPWKNGKDVLGFKMEDWKDGKLHGVFAIISDVAVVKAAQASTETISSEFKLAGFIGIGALISLFLAAFLIRSPLSRLKNVTEKLQQESSEVSAAVGQIFAISQELSSASTEQAAAVQETASAIEEISAMSKRSAENAEESEKAASTSTEMATSGQKIVDRLVESMGEINHSNEKVAEAVELSNQKITDLVTVIQEINNKTKVINDIVFQTKLLSFNASVEAARAGEHGKGFAVVAEEVGNLAQMSGNAAREISQLLEESVKKVEGVVSDTKASVAEHISSAKVAVEQGMTVTTECKEALTEIVSNSAGLTQMVSNISASNNEQSRGVTEIARAMQQIDETTQVGATSAERCAATADDLSEKAKGLRDAAASLRMTIDGSQTIARFRWGREYLIGVDAMDAEHQVLVEKMNALSDVLETDNLMKIKVAFRSLADYTTKHFSDEEQYMASIGYPQIEDHKKIHRRLLAGVADYGSKLEKGNLDPAELMNFLNDWLMKHIIGSDKKYAEHSRRTKMAA